MLLRDEGRSWVAGCRCSLVEVRRRCDTSLSRTRAFIPGHFARRPGSAPLCLTAECRCGCYLQICSRNKHYMQLIFLLACFCVPVVTMDSGREYLRYPAKRGFRGAPTDPRALFDRAANSTACCQVSAERGMPPVCNRWSSIALARSGAFPENGYLGTARPVPTENVFVYYIEGLHCVQPLCKEGR